MKTSSVLKNSKGQSTVEAILIMFIFLAIATTVANFFQERNVLSQITEKPWMYLAGMIEGGVWLPPDQVKEYHPNQWNRVRTNDPRSRP